MDRRLHSIRGGRKDDMKSIACCFDDPTVVQ